MTDDADLRRKAEADRNARPWRYYELDRETLLRMLDELADKADRLQAREPAQAWPIRQQLCDLLKRATPAPWRCETDRNATVMPFIEHHIGDVQRPCTVFQGRVGAAANWEPSNIIPITSVHETGARLPADRSDDIAYANAELICALRNHAELLVNLFGQAPDLLTEIAALPNIVVWEEDCVESLEGGISDGYVCLMCKAAWMSDEPWTGRATQHPENGCLYRRALDSASGGDPRP